MDGDDAGDVGDRAGNGNRIRSGLRTDSEAHGDREAPRNSFWWKGRGVLEHATTSSRVEEVGSAGLRDVRGDRGAVRVGAEGELDGATLLKATRRRRVAAIGSLGESGVHEGADVGNALLSGERVGVRAFCRAIGGAERTCLHFDDFAGFTVLPERGRGTLFNFGNSSRNRTPSTPLGEHGG